MKVRLQAVKMSEAKASHISLVERPANRTPFKVIKHEEPRMKFATLDLGRLMARKAETPTIELVGVATMKGEGFESVKKQVQEAGFDVTTLVDGTDADGASDDSTVFKQGDAKLEGDAVVIRMSDDVALVCKGFSPYMMDMSSEGVTFSDQVTAQGFYPSVSTVMDVARSAIYDTVSKADTPEAAAVAVSKMMGEVAKYAQSLVSSLPAKCFKLESIIVEKAMAEGSEAEEGKESAAMEAEEDKANKDKKAKKAEDDADLAAQSEDKTADVQVIAPVVEAAGVTLEQVTEVVKSSMVDVMKSVKELLQGMTTEVAKSVKEVSDKVGEVASEVKKNEEATTKVAKSIAGVVVTGADGSDHNPVAKRESGSAGRDIDTAYLPRHRAISR